MSSELDDDRERRVRLLRTVLRVMVILATFGCVASFAEPLNDPRVTAAFYGAVFVAIGVLHRALKRGAIDVAAWGVGLFLWALVAFVTLSFGGMQGQNAASFCAVAMLVGSLVGGRAAVGMALASVAWCGGIVLLERSGHLPKQLGPAYSPFNAWQAFTVTIVMVTTLLWHATESLRRMHLRAMRAAEERDEALRRSIQAQKMEVVGKLASGVAHDFNNLLTVVASATESLRREMESRPDAAAPLADIEEATARAALLTRQLLAFGRAKPSPTEVIDLASMVRAFGRLLPRLAGPSVRLDLAADAEAFVEASAAGLEQVLLNLVVNAREAMPHGGTLRVVVRTDGAEVVLLVEDDGVGMSDETRARLFTPFFTTKTGGTGLGLATVHEQVTRVGGRVEVESREPRGTRFAVRLPRAETPAPAPITPLPERVTAPSTTLLVVDDEPLVRRALARTLRRGGYEVAEAADGAEALDVLAARPEVKCVVSDVMMPRLDGRALAEKLATSAPDLPVVLVSGNAGPTEAGPRRAFLTKPVPEGALVAAVARLLGEGPAPPPSA